MKKIRQNAILDLVRSQEIASQEELLERLLARKIDVSQSTLSPGYSGIAAWQKPVESMR